MSVFLDNSHFINHLRRSCPFLCKIQAKCSALWGNDGQATRTELENLANGISNNGGKPLPQEIAAAQMLLTNADVMKKLDGKNDGFSTADMAALTNDSAAGE
ncbi:hypothetical protein RCH09_002367 [Actimicrobium sp. GrIS 1.19]|uniref:hypothetical protein n=1 Tax=Actimicrobium sp. GrIS 1.19 TaxID=3071708 RepID=UPI002E0116D0|nr:hypothetical protein [Actimicrobium sp. GrIS 1.19]